MNYRQVFVDCDTWKEKHFKDTFIFSFTLEQIFACIRNEKIDDFVAIIIFNLCEKITIVYYKK